MKNKIAEAMLKYIEKSPSAFHAVENVKQIYLEKGYTQLCEKDEWEIRLDCGFGIK